MSAAVLFWGALAASALAFALMAALIAATLREDASSYAREMGERTSRDFEDLFLFIPSARIARLGAYAAVAAFFLFFIPLLDLASVPKTALGVTLGAAAAFAAFSLPRFAVRQLRARRRLKFDEQLVNSLGSMANALRAGFSLPQAFESVARDGLQPISQEFGVLLRQLRVGMDFDEAMKSMARRVGSSDFELVAAAVEVTRRTGGNLTDVFERIAATIRSRMAIARRVRTLTAQGRLQGIVVSLMPVALGAILTVSKPALMIPFVTSGTGIACIAAALALVLAGWLVIRRIIRIDV